MFPITLGFPCAQDIHIHVNELIDIHTLHFMYVSAVSSMFLAARSLWMKPFFERYCIASAISRQKVSNWSCNCQTSSDLLTQKRIQKVLSVCDIFTSNITLTMCAFVNHTYLILFTFRRWFLRPPPRSSITIITYGTQQYRHLAWTDFTFWHSSQLSRSQLHLPQQLSSAITK